ncbi:hypothetical protein ABGT15_04845 [Flavobacterium enshiense]|uniref:hypothetical protein n=1 Tax=Flavobacterium enshiense TaxID=1341165 RepID=UPI00345D2BA1
MKLYVLNTAFEPNINRTQSIDPSNNVTFSGTDYNENEDFTEIINQLQYRLERDVHNKKFKDFLYEAIDFYNGPLILEDNLCHMLQFYTVSPKLKALLEQLKLPEHKFYPITLNIKDGVDLPYYIFQIKDNINPYMDYGKSSFYSILGGEKTIFYNEGEIKDEPHLLELLHNGFFPTEQKLFLKKELDWIYLAPYFIISEKSKQLFEENNIVGMEFTPFYELPSDYDEPNELGYLNYYGGREIIINGKNSMDGLNSNDFPRADNQ